MIAHWQHSWEVVLPPLIFLSSYALIAYLVLIYQIVSWLNSLHLDSSFFVQFSELNSRACTERGGATQLWAEPILMAEFCCSQNCSLIAHSALPHGKHPSSITAVSCTQINSQIARTFLKVLFQENTQKTTSPFWTSFCSTSSYNVLSNSTL